MHDRKDDTQFTEKIQATRPRRNDQATDGHQVGEINHDEDEQ